MKEKRLILLFAALLALLSACAALPEPQALIYETSVSPNEAFIESESDKVVYSIRVYRTANSVLVTATSNSPLSSDTRYKVAASGPVTAADIDVQWRTLSGRTEGTADDELALAIVTISSGGTVLSEETVSFVGTGVSAAADALGH